MRLLVTHLTVLGLLLIQSPKASAHPPKMAALPPGPEAYVSELASLGWTEGDAALESFSEHLFGWYVPEVSSILFLNGIESARPGDILEGENALGQTFVLHTSMSVEIPSPRADIKVYRWFGFVRVDLVSELPITAMILQHGGENRLIPLVALPHGMSFMQELREVASTRLTSVCALDAAGSSSWQLIQQRVDQAIDENNEDFIIQQAVCIGGGGALCLLSLGIGCGVAIACAIASDACYVGKMRATNGRARVSRSCCCNVSQHHRDAGTTSNLADYDRCKFEAPSCSPIQLR